MRRHADELIARLPWVTVMAEQRWIRVLPVTFVMYTIAFVDRTNVSLALPKMSHDLHMDAAQAGIASGIFFVGYVLLQIPGGYLASRWSPKWLVGIMLAAWGLCSAAAGLVHSWREFLLARFLLGVAEGGVWPATLVLIARWFPRAERARANAYWMLCLPAAAIFFSPLSGWILGRWNWRVLLVSEGLLPALWIIFWFALIDDYPSRAEWISAEEREYLSQAAGREASSVAEAATQQSLPNLLFRPEVLILLLISFLVSTGNYGFLFWLPTVLETLKLGSRAPLSPFQVGLLNSLPYLTAAIGMIVISKHSDRRQERFKHVAFTLGWAGTLLLVSVLVGERSPTTAFTLLCLATAGSFGMLGPFWTIPTELLPARAVGAAVGLIQLSNLGGAFGPMLAGLLQKHTGSFKGAFALMGLGWWVAAFLCLLIKPLSHRSTPLPNTGVASGR
jgi:MFS family permease